MITIKTFRFIIIAKAFLIIVGIIVSVFHEKSISSLPPGIRAYEFSQLTDHKGLLFDLLFLLVFYFCIFVDYIGLYLFKPFARSLYVILYIIVAIYTITNSQFIILTHIENTLSSITSLLSGIIISLLYFSPISNYFVKHKKTD
jgi:hypothetical protein